MNERIVIDPAICHDKPIVRGTRTPVTVVLDALAGGDTFEMIQSDYDITADDIRACVAFANHEVKQSRYFSSAGIGSHGEFSDRRQYAPTNRGAGLPDTVTQPSTFAISGRFRADNQIAAHAQSNRLILISKDRISATSWIILRINTSESPWSTRRHMATDPSYLHLSRNCCDKMMSLPHYLVGSP